MTVQVPAKRLTIHASRLSDLMGNVYHGVQFAIRDETGEKILAGAIDGATGRCTFAHGVTDRERVEAAKSRFLEFLEALI